MRLVKWLAGVARLRSPRAAEAAERLRRARELHDVVIHEVTAMVVQAEAARYLTASPERLEESLDAVTGTGRRAIAGLRDALELLRAEPGADDRRAYRSGLAG